MNIRIKGNQLGASLIDNGITRGSLHLALEQYKKEKGTFDIAVFGSSHAYRGYDPRIFSEDAHLKLFNFGSSAQSIPNTEMYLKYILKEDAFKVVLMDLFANIFEYSSLESSIILLRNSPSLEFSIEIFKSEKSLQLLNTFIGSQFTMNESNVYKNPDYVGYGYATNDNNLGELKKIPPLKKFVSTERALKSFKGILEYCERNKVPIVFVIPPLPKEIDIERKIQFSEFISDQLINYDFPIIDYSREHDLVTENNFYDYNHLNQNGVNYFNHRLIKDLKSLELIPEKN